MISYVVVNRVIRRNTLLIEILVHYFITTNSMHNIVYI